MEEIALQKEINPSYKKQQFKIVDPIGEITYQVKKGIRERDMFLNSK